MVFLMHSSRDFIPVPDFYELCVKLEVTCPIPATSPYIYNPKPARRWSINLASPLMMSTLW